MSMTEAAVMPRKSTPFLSRKARERLLQFVSPIGLLVIWQIMVMAGVWDARFIPMPTSIFARFYEMILSGELWYHVSVTLYRVSIGFVLGIVPAIVFGLLIAMFKPVRLFFEPLVAAIYPIPKVALMPVFLLVFGFGDSSKIAMVAFSAFFPVMINTAGGASNIDKIYIDVARNCQASLWMMFSRVVFFGALPMIMTGVRIAVATSLIVLVAAEFVASDSGIGNLIWTSWEILQVDRMFVGIVTIGLIGLITSALLREVERLILPWKP